MSVGRLAGKRALVVGHPLIADGIARRFAAEAALVGRTPGAGPAPDILALAARPEQPDALGGEIGRTLRETTPVMREVGGSVVLVGLAVGAAMPGGSAAFAAANGALRGLIRSCALELGESGIRVNLVMPGALAESARPETLGLIPLHRGGDASRRLGTVQDIVNAVLFLASDEAGYIHGAEFRIDGGLSECRDSVSGRAWDAASP